MKLQKFEFLLKKLNYPYSEELLINTEERLNFIEYLMRTHSETLFQYFQIDHSDLNSRIKSIKCQLLTTGIWGQSKHGKNVDLNKLIQGICSYEQSLSFVYKLTKCIDNNTQNIDSNISLFKDCIQLPYQLINTTYDPFVQTLPKDEEYLDAERIQQIDNDITDILELQQQDLNKLNERLDEEIINKDLGNISEKSKQDYINQMKKVNNMIEQIKDKKNILEQIEQQNEVNDDPKYTLIFPQNYVNVVQELNQLQNNIQQCNFVPQIDVIKEQTQKMIDQNFYFIQ